MRSTRRALVAPTVLVLGLGMAACGGDGDGDGDDTTTTASTSTTAPTTTVGTDASTTTAAAPGPGTEVPVTNDAGLAPGDPCEVGSDRDCIDPSGTGEGTYLLGGGDCLEAFADSPVLCEDLDGDGYAGYPDSG